MALLFDATTEVVNHGSDASLDGFTAFTVMIWGEMVTDGDIVYSVAIKGEDLGMKLNLNPLTPGGDMKGEVPGTTAGSSFECDQSDFAAWGLNKWLFIGYSLALNGVDGDQMGVVGDLSSNAAEPSSYTSQSGGSGSAGAESGEDLLIGRHTDNFRWRGRIAWVHVVNTNLTVAQMIDQQWNPHPISGSVIFSHYGYNGTTDCPDWSGTGNTGAITGATVADHVPANTPPFGYSAGWMPGMRTAAEVIQADKWHPNISQPYPYKHSIIPYQTRGTKGEVNV